MLMLHAVAGSVPEPRGACPRWAVCRGRGAHHRGVSHAARLNIRSVGDVWPGCLVEKWEQYLNKCVPVPLPP